MYLDGTNTRHLEQENDQSRKKVSKLIISPNNFWNLQWNNFVQCVFFIYIIIYPIYVAQNTDIDETHEQILLIFDITFIVDRILDLLVGYYNSDGSLEPLVSNVIWTNLDSKFFMEIFISFGHLIFFRLLDYRNSVIYGILKFLRYGRLFELDSQIENILEYYG